MKNKKLLILEAFVTILCIISLFVALNYKKEVRILEDQLSTIEAKTKQAQQNLNNLEQLKEDYKALQKTNETINGANEILAKDLISYKEDNKRLAKIVNDDEKILNNPNFEISYKELEDDKDYFALTIKSKTKGNYLIATDSDKWTKDQNKFLGNDIYETLTIENIIE